MKHQGSGRAPSPLPIPFPVKDALSRGAKVRKVQKLNKHYRKDRMGKATRPRRDASSAQYENHALSRYTPTKEVMVDWS